MFKIELIKENEFAETKEMMAKTTRTCFPPYYPQTSIEYLIGRFDIKKRVSFTHFYVVKNGNKIIGCGAIGPYWDSETESAIFNVFVDPEFQHQGVGTLIINTLEKDEYFLRANRIEISSAFQAIPFYKRFGYTHKNNELIYDDGAIKLEKYRTKS